MNKFLNKNVKGAAPKRKVRPIPERKEEYLQVLNEFAADWFNLDGARRKYFRSVMYSKGDQWGELVPDPDCEGQFIEEGELIKRNGKTPLKNNMISPIVNNIEGQFRTNHTKSVCYVRDQKEAAIGELFSTTLEYASDNNSAIDVDSKTLKVALNSGFEAYQVTYGMNEAVHRKDVWFRRVEVSRMFFNTDIEDTRMWDLKRIGELYDMTLQEVQQRFGGTKQRDEWIASIYGKDIDKSTYRDDNAMNKIREDYHDFYHAARFNKCRVIYGWRLETRDSYFWTDELDGTWGYLPKKKESAMSIEAENALRIEEGLANGMNEEDILLINYEAQKQSFWHYYYLTPYGDVLEEGDSPFWHGEHDYVLYLADLTDGVIYNYVEQFIDQQRAINRTATLIDFIRGTSSKGVLIVDETAFAGMSRDEIVDNFVRYNGVLYATLKNGQRIDDVIKQYNANASVAGDYELLNLHLRLINEISGVSGAMQGQAPTAGTAASLYDQQVQNSSLNLRGTLDGFKEFLRRRDYKIIQLQQQYYHYLDFIRIAGPDYLKNSTYTEEEVKNAMVDISINEGGNTPTYQMQMNNFLLELLRMNAIGIETFLDNCSYPFAPKILEAIQRANAQMQSGQPVTGIDPNLMASVQGMAPNQHLNRLMNDDGQTPSLSGKTLQTA